MDVPGLFGPPLRWRWPDSTGAAHAAVALLPGALIVYLGFNAGGFFPGATGLAAVVVALALVLRVTLAERPFAGYGPALQIAAGALALYAVWTLLSSGWSDAPARALLEFDRAVLYLLVLLLVGSLPGEPAQLRLVIYGLVLGATVVCVAGLASRVAPDIVHASPDIVEERLSFPVTYWNALGLLAGLALIAAAHLTCDAEEPRAVRVVAAGTTPLLAATLLFTYSRGAIAAAALGLATYLAVGRPRHAVAGLLAAVPASAVAVIAAYRANLLASDEPTTSAAAAQGHRVALAVGACGLAAALVRCGVAPGGCSRRRHSARARLSREGRRGGAWDGCDGGDRARARRARGPRYAVRPLRDRQQPLKRR